MSIHSPAGRAIQHTARICAVLLLCTLATGSVVALAGRSAQATTPAATTPTPATSAPALEPEQAQPPVQAEIPVEASAAAQPSASVPSQTIAPQAQAVGGALPASAAVGDDWFADAAFVGDSRTEGLLLYSGLKAGGGFAYRGLNVQSVCTDPVISSGGRKVTAVEALSQGTYNKIYLMLGINELGWYNDARFETCYAQLIDQVRQAQPQADIYLQTLIPVTAEKSAASYINNPQILVYNEIITRLAQEKGTYLVDTWSAFADEAGTLPGEGSVDGVHLTREYYVKWLDYLKTHTAP